MDAPEQRLNRLEELQSFAERDMEAMSAELKRAFDAIRALTARLDALDHRTASLENPIKLPEDERPPHSAGPRE